ncbi:hypothetical protein CBR_g8256 [Chara braunii]|uniref:Protein kinase domain-containing protein n=1 Tax=Chara braunii TaxID=69332 RepID=A0A388KLM9_CHABU|nr:hypothetical protein CBR_g8256 [Chara braunii]|eukprot:GBG70956.1 hypothetical protein CBR_g8256 [Chara braunii]
MEVSQAFLRGRLRSPPFSRATLSQSYPGTSSSLSTTQGSRPKADLPAIQAQAGRGGWSSTSSSLSLSSSLRTAASCARSRCVFSPGKGACGGVLGARGDLLGRRKQRSYAHSSADLGVRSYPRQSSGGRAARQIQVNFNKDGCHHGGHTRVQLAPAGWHGGLGKRRFRDATCPVAEGGGIGRRRRGSKEWRNKGRRIIGSRGPGRSGAGGFLGVPVGRHSFMAGNFRIIDKNMCSPGGGLFLVRRTSSAPSASPTTSASLLPELLTHFHVTLGVGVGLPCSVMDCGDVVYRSTLPPPPAFSPTAGGVILALMVIGYLWATPGVAPGFWDMFVVAPLEAYFRPKVTRSDIKVGKKLGEGAYGSVYRASLSTTEATGRLIAKMGSDQIVVKKANEYGAVEIWMNERVRRGCGGSCADFVYGFMDSSALVNKRKMILGDNKANGREESFWLIWRFEGESTLADLMQAKDFPYNCERLLYGDVLPGDVAWLPKGSKEREGRVIRAILNQILTALRRLHDTGIVHRDVKPQNLIFAEDTRQLRIIDLGAAADLRVGINYVPQEFLLDPRYAAPEQYIMSTQTPSAPSPPVATALSPVLWQLNKPDRFDMYSVGLIFLQLVFPTLRPDSGLIQFNRALKKAGYDIVAWREQVESKSRVAQEYKHGFEILDMDDGAGWDLVQKMVSYKGRQRISAGGALDHPYFDSPSPALLGVRVGRFQRLRLMMDNVAFQSNTGFADWVWGMMARSGTKDVGGFTEAQLSAMVERDQRKMKRKVSLQRNAIVSALRLRRRVERTIGQTVSDIDYLKKARWWNRWQQQRQEEQRRLRQLQQQQQQQQPEPKR